MAEKLEQGELLTAIRSVLEGRQTNTYFAVLSAEVHGGVLFVEFHWHKSDPIYGVKIEVPDTTDHPSWKAWDPQSVEEWANYAVKVRLIEELDTNLLGRAARFFDGRVVWLDLPD